MSNDKLEELSAWMDGGLSGDRSSQMAEVASAQSDLKSAWGRYHLIGAAMREEVVPHDDLKFSERVSAVLAREPAIVAPRTVNNASSRKPRAVWAAAAAIAAVSILAAQSNWRSFLPSGTEQDLAASFSGEIAPLPIATRSWQGQHAGPSPQLSGYLVNHSQATSNRQLEGIPPYARLVGYEAEQ